KNILTWKNAQDSKVVKLILENLWNPEVLTDKEVNYLTMREDCMMSFLPAGKPLLLNDNGEWKREGRQTGKMNKVSKKIWTKQALDLLTDKDFEDFANLCKGEVIKDYTFDIVDGDDIPETYD